MTLARLFLFSNSDMNFFAAVVLPEQVGPVSHISLSPDSEQISSAI